jgi:phosphoglycerol transferase
VNALWLAITVLMAGIALPLVLQLWRADPHTPPSGGFDNEQSLMLVTNVLRSGWDDRSPQLGAPFGQKHYDFPSGDVVHPLVVKGLGLLNDDPVVAVNFFYRLTFLTIAASAFLSLRLLKISLPIAAATAVLYSFLPYHFIRLSFGHLYLLAYEIVPLACALLIRQLGDEPLFDLRSLRAKEGVQRGPARRRALLALFLCVLVGLSGVYYAIFTIILLALAGTVRALAARSLQVLLSSFVLVGVAVATLVLALLPSLLYIQHNGPNGSVTQRGPIESQLFGLKLVNLVLPTPGHRVKAMDIRPTSDESELALPGEGTETLGLIGTAGFLGLVLVGLRRLVSTEDSLSGHTKSMSTLLLLTLLLGTVAGLGALIAEFGFVYVRAWNRISVFVAFIALGGVGVALDRVTARTRDSRRGLSRLCVVLLVPAIGIADQTSPSFVPRYESLSRAWRADDAFFGFVESKYGTADVFQLPVMDYPESPGVGNVSGYSHLRGYLHSEKLRWSFGGMKGRESDWQEQLAALPVLELVPRVALAGFEALYVDRAGYADSGDEIARQLAPYVEEPLVSRDRRLAVYDLRAVQEQLRNRLGAEAATEVGDLVTHPAGVRWGQGFAGTERRLNDIWRWSTSNGEMTLVNTNAQPRELMLAFELESLPGTTVVVESGGGQQLFRSPPGRRAFRLNLGLTSKEAKIRFRSEPAQAPARRIRAGPAANPAIDWRFRVLNPRIEDNVLVGLLQPSGRTDLLVPSSRASVPEALRMPPVPPPRKPSVPIVMPAAIIIFAMVLTYFGYVVRSVGPPGYPRQDPSPVPDELRRPANDAKARSPDRRSAPSGGELDVRGVRATAPVGDDFWFL